MYLKKKFQTQSGVPAFDARRNFERAGAEFSGKYNTDVFTDEAIRIISSHDQSKPLFLELAYTAVHAIFGNTLQVRNLEENNKRFAYIEDPQRRLFAGTFTMLNFNIVTKEIQRIKGD